MNNEKNPVEQMTKMFEEALEKTRRDTDEDLTQKFFRFIMCLAMSIVDEEVSHCHCCTKESHREKLNHYLLKVGFNEDLLLHPWDKEGERNLLNMRWCKKILDASPQLEKELRKTKRSSNS